MTLLLFKLYKRKKIPEPFLSILLALLILPLGYLAMHIETRYIWLTTFLIMPLGIYLINERVMSKKRGLFIVFFSLSFIPFLIKDYVQLAGKNNELFELSNVLEAQKISGKIVSNVNDEGSFWVVSYLANLNNYTIEQSEYTVDKLVEEMKRYGVNQYVHFSNQGGSFKETDKAFIQNFESQFRLTRTNISFYKLRN